MASVWYFRDEAGAKGFYERIKGVVEKGGNCQTVDTSTTMEEGYIPEKLLGKKLPKFEAVTDRLFCQALGFIRIHRGYNDIDQLYFVEAQVNP